jgi:hypothetical protein
MADETSRLANVGVLLEDYAAFGEWLVAHADEVVGVPMECALCPLAVWLDDVVGDGGDTDGDEAWLVTPARCRQRGGWEAWPLPSWAKLFVEGVDARYGCYGYVTGGMAFEVLKAVVP